MVGKEQMTDEEMLKHALKIYRYDWSTVSRYEDEAKDPEIKARLHQLAVSGYHREEARSGLI